MVVQDHFKTGPLRAYVQEVLRWNQQVNLVSRQDTAHVLQGLLEQCVQGFDALWAAGREEGWILPDLARVRYFDLGSGGGLPGVVWHHLLTVRGLVCSSWLVEPRDKRAWFLERVAQIPNLGPFEVLQGRWGEVALENPAPDNSNFTLISLKALHLTDPEVLSGVVVGHGDWFPDGIPGQVVVARYYPADQALDTGLRSHLDLPLPGACVQMDGQNFTWEGASLIQWANPGPREACLVVSRYSC